MTKRKLMPFYGQNGYVVYVPEIPAKHIMNSFGDIEELKVTVFSDQVSFKYKTKLGHGTLVLEGQKP